MANAEERPIEQIRILQERTRLHIVRILDMRRGDARGKQFRIGEERDRLTPTARLRRYSSIDSAPGKRSAMPTMAMPTEGEEWSKDNQSESCVSFGRF